MPAEIESMAYVGEVPWHGLGEKFDRHLTSQEMLEAADLNWTVEKIPSFDAGGVQMPFFAIRRIRDQRILSLKAVGSDYTPLQNHECFGVLDGILGDKAHFETAASLREGSRVFALARIHGDIEIPRVNGTSDVLERYLLAYNSHDGSFMFTLANTNVRVVCQNTAEMAMSGSQSRWRIPHTSGIKKAVEEAQASFKAILKHADMVREVSARLEAERMSREEVRFFATKLIAETELAITSAKQVTEARAATIVAKRDWIVDSFEHGRGNLGESRLDAFNGVTDYVDHARNIGKRAADEIRRQMALTDDCWFGTGARLKRRALKMLVKI